MIELISHVAVVSGSRELRERWLLALEECSRNEPTTRTSCAYQFLSCESSEQALELATRDGLLQAVIIDAVTIDRADELVDSLKSLRAELDLFLAVEQSSELSGQAAELLDRNDDNFNHLFRQLQSAIQHRANTPFADTLRDYVHH